MYQVEFAATYQPAREVFITTSLDEPLTTCNVHMYENDETNLFSFGTCEIMHGESVVWNMANGHRYDFEYVQDFNSPQITEDSDAIARYFFQKFDGSSHYLWETCDHLDRNDPNFGDRLTETLTILVEMIIQYEAW